LSDRGGKKRKAIWIDDNIGNYISEEARRLGLTEKEYIGFLVNQERKWATETDEELLNDLEFPDEFKKGFITAGKLMLFYTRQMAKMNSIMLEALLPYQVSFQHFFNQAQKAMAMVNQTAQTTVNVQGGQPSGQVQMQGKPTDFIVSSIMSAVMMPFMMMAQRFMPYFMTQNPATFNMMPNFQNPMMPQFREKTIKSSEKIEKELEL